MEDYGDNEKHKKVDDLANKEVERELYPGSSDQPAFAIVSNDINPLELVK